MKAVLTASPVVARQPARGLVQRAVDPSARDALDERREGGESAGSAEAASPPESSFGELPILPRLEAGGDLPEDEIEDEGERTKDGEAAATSSGGEGEDEDEEGEREEDLAPVGAGSPDEPVGPKRETGGGGATASGPPPPAATGRPLPTEVERSMGRAFGTGFGDVRIHEGPRATAAGALAYTRGEDIHFAPGRFRPGSARGLRLLAHELAHVVQQRRAGPEAARQTGILDDPVLEAEAETLGARAARGEDVRVRHAARGGSLRAADLGASRDGREDRPGDAGPIQRVSITWDPPNERVGRRDASSTTTERRFAVDYDAVADPTTNTWKLDVASITGGVNIVLNTGGSRNPFDREPTTEAQARRAVRVMRGYYARGTRGSWHTVDASRAHENYHYTEWKCSAEHYWPAAEAAIRALSIPLASQPDAARAERALRRTVGGRRGADAMVRRFQRTARRYWFTLSDRARSRPYAAGQRELNDAIRWVQILALIEDWDSVDQRDPPEPSTADPCYRPHLRYTP